MGEIPKGTITLSGRLAVPNKPVFSISLTLTSSSPFEIAIDITRGDHFLRGKLTGDWEVTDGQSEVTNWQIELKNENDLVVKIHEDTNKQVVGTIFAPDGTTKLLADIGKDPDLGIVIVRYIDGTLESLLPTDLTYSPKPVLGTVRGKVTNAETGQGISGAWVCSGYETTVTDNEGFYELKAIAGHQTIRVSHWDYLWKAVEVDVPAHGTVTVNI